MKDWENGCGEGARYTSFPGRICEGRGNVGFATRLHTCPFGLFVGSHVPAVAGF